MSELDLLPLTRIGASPRERLLRHAAAMGTALVAVLLLGVAAMSGSLPAAAGGVVALVAAALSRRPAQPTAAPAIRIDSRGSAYLRLGGGPEQPASLSLLAPWLIVLRAGGHHVALWPDQLPADRFRRASAVLRWTPPRTAADPGTNAARFDADR